MFKFVHYYLLKKSSPKFKGLSGHGESAPTLKRFIYNFFNVVKINYLAPTRSGNKSSQVKLY